MAHASEEYHRGEMEITEQKASYALFGALAKWGSLAVGVVLLMLTLWFCVGADFFGGLIPGAILLVLGVVFLRSKPGEGH